MKKSNPKYIEGYRRLHPVSVLYFFIKSLKVLYGLIPLVPAILLASPKIIGSSLSKTMLLTLLVVLILIVLIAAGILNWRYFLYRVEKGSIQIQQGIWSKKNTWITSDKIQSIDTTEKLYDRLFGLVRLQVETAGGGEKAEVVLSSISVAEAGRVRSDLGFSRKISVSDSSIVNDLSTEVDPIHFAQPMRLSNKQLVIHSSTSGKFGVTLAIMITVISKLLNSGLKSSDILSRISRALGPGWIPLFIALIIIISWCIAVAITYLGDYKYELDTKDDRLFIEHGLLEKKKLTIPLQRIQAIHFIQQPIHRALGLLSVRAVVAGNSDGKQKWVTLFPLLKKSELEPLIERFVPSYVLPAEWTSIDVKAKRNYIWIPVVITLLLTIPAILWIPNYLGLLTLLLPLMVYLYGLRSYRTVAWSMDQQQLGLRYGALSVHEVLIPRKRIQWSEQSQPVWQKRRNLADLSVSLASGKGFLKFKLRYASKDVIQELLQFISIRNHSS